MKDFLRRSLLLALFAGAAIPAARAQDFERIAPKMPVRREGELQIAGRKPKIGGDTAVLAPALRAAVFVPKAADVKKAGLQAKGVQSHGLPLLKDEAEDFREVVQRYLGKPVTMRSLNELARDVVLFYRENDRPVVDVIIPEQDITNGVVQFVVMEARLGQVKVEGNKHFTTEFLRDQVRMEKGDPFRESILRADLDWVNNNPFRLADFIYTPGTEVGTADLLMRVQDRRTWRVYGGYENSGNRLTGEDRVFAGFNWGNAFGLDHQLNYQFTTDPTFEHLRAHSASYVIPLPWRHILTFYGSYADLEADLPPPLNLTGTSWQGSVRYTMPLRPIWSYRHQVITGFDVKRTDNNLEFGGTPVLNATADIAQWMIGYGGTLKDLYGATSWGASGYYSPGDWMPHQHTSDYQMLRAFAEDEYKYARFNLERLSFLPADFTLFSRFEYQISDGNLLPSEQLGLGGYRTVRGYDELEALGDEGLFM
ncbi:MAG: ShlB/FhaC/HecB family hemolysin secretion/activation protein, partial [Verrucomicrobiae bacterium]|nr:ShlB/FhaC/HecB family hemolysin secretion/activation protein [Verrucomicrobiae bacterium]